MATERRSSPEPGSEDGASSAGTERRGPGTWPDSHRARCTLGSGGSGPAGPAPRPPAAVSAEAAPAVPGGGGRPRYGRPARRAGWAAGLAFAPRSSGAL